MKSDPDPGRPQASGSNQVSRGGRGRNSGIYKFASYIVLCLSWRHRVTEYIGSRLLCKAATSPRDMAQLGQWTQWTHTNRLQGGSLGIFWRFCNPKVWQFRSRSMGQLIMDHLFSESCGCSNLSEQYLVWVSVKESDDPTSYSTPPLHRRRLTFDFKKGWPKFDIWI